MRQEFATLLVSKDGKVKVNPKEVTEWLIDEAIDGNYARVC